MQQLKAIRFLLESASRGNLEAHIAIASLYADGTHGFRKNPELALQILDQVSRTNGISDPDRLKIIKLMQNIESNRVPADLDERPVLQ